MTRFQVFETKEQAEECVKKDGGILCDKNDEDYDACVYLGGLDSKKYPYCVVWKGRDIIRVEPLQWFKDNAMEYVEMVTCRRCSRAFEVT